MSSLKKTLVLKIDPANPDKEAIARSARMIREGGLVAFPTETVYGLAANLLDEKAIDTLYQVKNRPKDKPFTVHVAGIDALTKMGCKVSAAAKILIGKYWPGPLTLLLPTRDGQKIGLRMPANKVALELIKAAGVPVVAPSANLSGNVAPTDARQVLNELDGMIDIVLDAGRTDFGVESTIVDMTKDPVVVVREGAIRKEDIFKVLNGDNNE